jgi:zinc finger/BTB domain-containing protein 17
VRGAVWGMNARGPKVLPILTTAPTSTDPNTHILYACDSCGDKFLDANSLAQHVRIHTAQALVMFQTDADFYQQYGPGSTWPAGQMLQAGELVFRPRDGTEGQPTLAESPPTAPDCLPPAE